MEGSHQRKGETLTVAKGVDAPVALPGWALTTFGTASAAVIRAVASRLRK